MVVHEMTRRESVAILSSRRFARLACVKENQPCLVPRHYAFSDNHLYSFALSDQKVGGMRKNAHVCVQVDECAPIDNGAVRRSRPVRGVAGDPAVAAQAEACLVIA